MLLTKTIFICFISYDEEYHRTALIEVPGTAPKVSTSCGLEHIAFSYPRLEDLLLASHGICPVDIQFSPDCSKAMSESTGTVTIRFEGSDGNLYENMSWVRFISRWRKLGKSGNYQAWNQYTNGMLSYLWFLL